MNAFQLLAERYDAMHDGVSANVLDGLSDDQVRARPHGLKSIAWLLWHAARIEDVATNRFVANRPQVFDRDAWSTHLNVDRRDVGVGMTAGEVEDLSQEIDLAALQVYWSAVAANTREVMAGLSSDDLDITVPADHVWQVVREEGVLLPAGHDVGEFWAGGRTRGWFLLQTALLHPYGHLFDFSTVRGILLGE